jgi:hypothetical protein
MRARRVLLRQGGLPCILSKVGLIILFPSYLRLSGTPANEGFDLDLADRSLSIEITPAASNLLPIAPHDGQYKQGRDAKIIYIFNMVGATGIEPVTPTMST